MYITVVADGSGKIVGFAYDAPGRAPAANLVTALATGDGQERHSVELSPELLQRVGEDDFDEEVFRHVVVKRGKKVVLARAESAKS